MAKKKPETLVEKISEGVDKILHPENHSSDFREGTGEDKQLAEAAAKTRAEQAAKKSDESSDELTKNKAEPVDVKSIAKHKKFDKFQNQGEHLDDK